MISKDKQYRTRDGREVRIYATDGVGECPIHGAIKGHLGWSAALWREDGKCHWCSSSFGYGPPTPNFDLIEVKPRHKRTVWLNVFEGDGGVGAFTMKEAADSFNSRRRIACLRLDLDFEEGEGL